MYWITSSSHVTLWYSIPTSRWVKEFLESSYILCKSRSRDQLHWHNTQVGRLQHTSVKNCLNLATSIKKKEKIFFNDDAAGRKLVSSTCPAAMFLFPPNACFFYQVFINLFSLSPPTKLRLLLGLKWDAQQGHRGSLTRKENFSSSSFFKNWNHKKVVIKWKWGGLSRKEEKSRPQSTTGWVHLRGPPEGELTIFPTWSNTLTNHEKISRGI